jgi:hypothetical protein
MRIVYYNGNQYFINHPMYAGDRRMVIQWQGLRSPEGRLSAYKVTRGPEEF